MSSVVLDGLSLELEDALCDESGRGVCVGVDCADLMSRGVYRAMDTE